MTQVSSGIRGLVESVVAGEERLGYGGRWPEAAES